MLVLVVVAGGGGSGRSSRHHRRRASWLPVVGALRRRSSGCGTRYWQVWW